MPINSKCAVIGMIWDSECAFDRQHFRLIKKTGQILGVMKQIFCTGLKGQEKPVKFCYTPRTKLLLFSMRESGTEIRLFVIGNGSNLLSECNDC